MQSRLAVIVALVLAPAAVGQEKKSTAEVLEIGGRTLEQWIKDIPSKDRSKGENAIRTIILFPPDKAYVALPTLLAELRKHSVDTPIDMSIRVNIAIALGVILGSVQGAEGKQLTEAVTLLTRLTKDNQGIVRYRAIEALGRIGNDAKAAIPELLTALKDKSTWEVRQAAAAALGFVAQNPKTGPSTQVLQGLYGALGDSALQVRLSAIQSLTFVGGSADPTVRKNLVAALEPLAYKDPEPVVQIWANMAIMNMTDVSPERMGIVIGHLKSNEPGVRIQAAHAVGMAAGKAKQAVPNLIANLPDTRHSVQGWTIWALGQIGPYAAEAIPALQKIANDDKTPEPVKVSAKEAIEQIKGKKKK